MMYIKYFLFAIISLFLNIFIALTSPIWSAWSVIAKRSVLPYPFSLIHSHDDDLDGGQHQLGWPPAKGLKLWKQRMKWICRNPGYGFDSQVLGFKTDDVIFEKHDVHWDGLNCKVNILMKAANGKKYFSYRRQKVYGKHYLKLWLGWHYEAKDGKYHMLKFDFHPMRKVY